MRPKALEFLSPTPTISQSKAIGLKLMGLFISDVRSNESKTRVVFSSCLQERHLI
ncbi:unnamed protein product [Schistosoma curassoni]|uniref:Uncharacterized protein n=1 Tax=Schistosoma curassoni TaxID=6186 RepID=A0A183K990_9TREM|nr:unnamed protein product [Schistosoma curassoni]